MNITEDQYTKMKQIFEGAYEYAQMIKEHNSAKTELFTNFLEEICPKPSGKMSPADKDHYKEAKKEAKQFISDTYRIYVRDKEMKPDTTPEALQAIDYLK